VPGITDDIIIKRRSLKGLLKAAEHQAIEIAENDMLAACQDLDAELHKVYVPFRDMLIKVTEAMKDRLTKKLVP
jgi:hypothetical protein